MSSITEEVNLKSYTTFGIDARCDFFTEIRSIEEFQKLIRSEVYKNNPRLIIGGGSNLLFTKDFKGLVIKNSLKGLEIVSETDSAVIVKAGAGEVWHDFVMWCIDHHFCGLENLSLIPGCVGASPMQNIGAYGVEIKEVFRELEAYDMITGEKRIFTKEQCKFGYRESVFKREFKDKYLIASVSFELQKHARVNVSYGAITSELEAAGVKSPTIKDVSEAVIRIRRSKLPDPAQTGNAGSFFKNPEVSAEQHAQLKSQFPELVSYPLADGGFKLAAGWLIEQAGLKGYEHNGAAVHTRQALVLINKNNATGKAVFELSDYVLRKVFDKFGVQLEREVNII
ncbi:MAG: UDP-N-acetylenolpyruvoylglucosamine reductase [Bacteroidetes bacterium]|nr:UDP-N-acetylenolpyruvoylglucosamine reductase [Bacteroidota bacterium]